MNPVDKHLAAQAEKFAPRNEPFKDSVERLSWENIRRGERHAFLAGAQAAKEIYLLQGEAKAYRLSGMEGAAEEAEAQLEKLLSEKGEG